MMGIQAWAAAAAFLLAGLLPQAADELLRRSDVGAFAPSSFRARLVLKSQPRNVAHVIEVWRAGEQKTLIRLLDAKDRGKFLLRLGEQTWLLTPGAKKPVKLSPSYRLYGGATVEEVLGTRLASNYDIAGVSNRADPDGALVVFDLRAKTESTLFRRVEYVVRERTARPVRATYRLRSGRAATAVEFVDWNERGQLYARRVVVHDLLRQGATTDVEVAELEERAVPEGLFSLDDATARRALETPAPAAR